jgi:hypothetical protein
VNRVTVCAGNQTERARLDFLFDGIHEQNTFPGHDVQPLIGKVVSVAGPRFSELVKDRRTA